MYGIGEYWNLSRTNGKNRLARTPVNTTRFIFRNNIVYSETAENLMEIGMGATGNWLGTITLDNNLYYMNAGGNMIDFNGTVYTTSQFATYQTQKSQDANSVYTDPLFISKDEHNTSFLVPYSNSPACTMSSTGGYVGAIPCSDLTDEQPVVIIENITLNMTFDSDKATYDSTFATDTSGSGHDSIMVDTAYRPSIGKVGGSYYFIADNYIYIAPYNVSGNLSRELSACAWIKTSDNNQTIVAQWDTNARRVFTLETFDIGDASDSVRVMISSDGAYTAGSVKDYRSSIVINDDEWHHTCFTYDNGGLSIFVDGVNDTAVTKTYDSAITQTYTSSVANITIGGRRVGTDMGQDFAGYIDEVLLWNYSLSSAQITSLYESYPRPNGNYYFSNTEGNDANECTLASPCKTINKLNSISLSPGTNIYFKRGDYWRFPADAYLSADSGNSSHYITYSAYGEGAKPLFLGSNVSTSTDDWKLVGGYTDIWQYNKTSRYDVGNLVFTNGSSFGIRNYTMSELTRQGNYLFNTTTNITRINSSTNPVTFYGDIEFVFDNTLIEIWTKNYNIYRNLSLKYSAETGFNIGSRNILIQECDVSYIGGGLCTGGCADPRNRWGNGIQLWKGAQNILVENNKVWEIYDAALTTQGYADTDYLAKNHTYRNNLVWNVEYGFELSQQDIGSNISNITIDHNTFYDMGNTWGHSQRIQTVWSRCFRYATTYNATGINHTNNICYESEQYALTATGTTPLIEQDAVFYSDYNLLMRNISGGMSSYLVYWQPLGQSYTTLLEYQTNTSKDLNSISADPLFISTNATNESFLVMYSNSPGCTMSTTGSYVGALPCSTEGACTTNLVNTSWGAWRDVACEGDYLNQERNLTQYDNNYCGEVANTTFYEYQLISDAECAAAGDTVPPRIQFLSPQNTTYAYKNITISLQSDITNHTVWFNNETHNVTYTNAVVWNFTEGGHTLRAWANDSNGNINTTTIKFTIDTIPPYIKINSPTNTTYTTNSVLINLTTTGTYTWFSNGTHNVTYTTPVTKSFANGGYTVWAYTNDSVGNLNSTTIKFTVNYTAPYPRQVLNLVNLSSSSSAILLNFTYNNQTQGGALILLNNINVANTTYPSTLYQIDGLNANTTYNITLKAFIENNINNTLTANNSILARTQESTVEIQQPSSVKQSCAGAQTSAFTGFGLIAVILIAGTALILWRTFKGDDEMDGYLSVGMVAGMVGLGIVLISGFIIIGIVGSGIC